MHACLRKPQWNAWIFNIKLHGFCPFWFWWNMTGCKWSWGKALFQASYSTRNTAWNQKEHQNTSNRSNTSDTSKPSKSSNRKVNLWQVWTWETIRNKCLCHLRVIEVHLLQYFIWLELPAMALYLRLTSDGFVTCVIFDLSSVYLGLTWVFWPDELTQSYSRVFLLTAPWAVNLACNRFLFEHVLLVSLFFRISQINLKIFSFSRIQDKILINNSFLSGMRNAFYMHFWSIFLCILYAFLMHFICISYAFLMHFSKMHVFSSKMHVFWSKMHVFLKSAYKMHIKCL